MHGCILAMFLLCLLRPEPASAAVAFQGPTGARVEISGPTGPFAGKRPHGTALVIHGGAWALVGEMYLESERETVELLTRSGWRAVNLDYGAGARSLPDVLATYDWARRRYGHGEPLCALGSSAGGHLALMLAALRPAVACVVGRGAITDLLALRTDSPLLYGWAASFFKHRLRTYSPTAYGVQMRADVLLGVAAGDPLLPQQDRYLAADPGSRGVTLESGDVHFVHANVSTAALRRFRAEIRAILRRTLERRDPRRRRR